jgi:hypothetical protein
VFPLRPGDKRPAAPDHPAERCTGADPRCAEAGVHVGWEARATTDPDRIRRAWTARPYNVGIACGPSGLVVVDLDTPKPGQAPPASDPPVRHGADVFARLCAARTADPAEVYDTYTVRTGRGGTHLYFRHPENGPALRNTAGTLGWLVDTRAHGGYVVAAGGIVGHRPYSVVNPTDPAPLPGWLAAQLRPVERPAAPVVPLALDAARHGRYLAAAITRQVAEVTGAPVGRRNAALYMSALILGQLVAGGALQAGEVIGLLTQAASSAGLRPAETAATIASGLRAGARRPRTIRVAA